MDAIPRGNSEQIRSVIPDLSDAAANHANMAAIDLLALTQKYWHLIAWGKFLGLTPETVREYVKLAHIENAPADAIQKIGQQWLCVSDIRNEANRNHVNSLAESSRGSRRCLGNTPLD